MRLTFVAVRRGALLLFCVAGLLYRCEKWADGCLLLAGSVGTAALDKSENTDTRNNAIDFSALGFLVMGTSS